MERGSILRGFPNSEKFDYGAFGGPIFTIGALAAAALTLARVVALAPQVFAMPHSFSEAEFGDIDGYIRAGIMAAEGQAAAAYDREAFSAGLDGGTKGLAWSHPPHAFFFAAPLSVIPFVAIRPIWIALTTASMMGIALVAGMRKPLALAIVLCSPAAFAIVYFLQVSAFIALGLSFALLIAPKRPILAGVILGMLTMKPQYGVLCPILLAATGQWRAIAAAAMTALALIAGSVVVFGADAWRVFLTSGEAAKELYFAHPYSGAVSVGQAAAKLGANADLSAAIQAIAAAGFGAVVFIAARKLDYKSAVALTLLLALAASGSTWPHDWPLLVASLAIFTKTRPHWPPLMQAIALLAWMTPIILLFALSYSAPTIILFTFVGAMVWWTLAPPAARAAAAPPDRMAHALAGPSSHPE